MGKVNLRLNTALFTFSLALLSSVCLGYYGMSQSGLRASQEAEIRQEIRLGAQLEREITQVENQRLSLFGSAATDYRAHTGFLGTLIAETPEAPVVDALTEAIKNVKCTPAPHFEELVESQKQELQERLGIFERIEFNDSIRFR